MQISLSNTAPATRQAQEEVTVMVRQALKILQDAGIEEKNISTASLRFYPEYEWTGSRQLLLGQKAEQSIIFSVDSINTDSEKVSAIIDALIQINGIQLNQTQFRVKDSAELFARSRELAYPKALEQAEQYAKLAGLTIVKVLNIMEEGSSPVSPIYNRALNNTMMDTAEKMEAAAGSTVVPAGELEITSRIVVEFMLK
jgi:uncharacterized protein YggE